MTYHTFGDSHSSKLGGWTYCKNIDLEMHNIGALLCYSFGNEHLNRCDIRKFDVKDGDTIIFCLGEVDCRCHIHKHITRTLTYKHIIDDIIDKYIKAIKIIVTISQLKFKNICIYNVVPPIEKKKVSSENPEYPYLGSDEERKKYVLYFNDLIKKKCVKNKFIFFDIYDKYTDKNGYLRKDLSDGNVHIRDGRYISDFINETLI